MIYLDNAATGGFKPYSVQNAVSASLKACANPGRSGHRLSLALAQHVFACRRLLCDLFGGYALDRVVFTRSCTEALNIAILGTLNKGDHVVTTALEHNSVLRPLEHLKKSGVISYDVAPLTGGKLLLDSVLSLVKENTRAVCITSASNVTGECPDLALLRKKLPERVLLIVDGAQGAGHIPIDMKKTGIDALAIAGHKGMYAMQGIGALLFSERMSPRPLLFGGTGSESFSLDMPAFYPDALESGTLSYPNICSLYEGAIIVKTSLREHAQTLLNLTTALQTAFGAMENYTLYSAPNRCGIVTFKHNSLPSETVAARLSERFDIAVRGGYHCAPLVHRALGTDDGLVRASFSPLQTMREGNALIGALKKLT